MNQNVRRTSTKTCNQCGQEKGVIEFNPDKRGILGRKARCKVCLNEYSRLKQFAKKYAARNWDEVSAYRKQWVKDNYERYKEVRRRWVRNNKKKVLHETRKYQAAKLLRCPKWLTKEQLMEVRVFYERCPAGQEVDHIVPLQGKNVSGLHVPWNLQYLIQEANRRKSNANQVLEAEDKKPRR